MSQTGSVTKRLDGKIAVITGGNSGIGLATAQRFVQEGAYVFITGRRQSELDIAVKQIGNNVTGVQGDVSNIADLDRLYGAVKHAPTLILTVVTLACTSAYIAYAYIAVRQLVDVSAK